MQIPLFQCDPRQQKFAAKKKSVAKSKISIVLTRHLFRKQQITWASVSCFSFSLSLLNSTGCSFVFLRPAIRLVCCFCKKKLLDCNFQFQMYSIIFICVLFLILYAFRNCLMETGKLLEKHCTMYKCTYTFVADSKQVDCVIGSRVEPLIQASQNCASWRSPKQAYAHSQLVVLLGVPLKKFAIAIYLQLQTALNITNYDFFNSVTFENLLFLRHMRRVLIHIKTIFIPNFSQIDSIVWRDWVTNIHTHKISHLFY